MFNVLVCLFLYFILRTGFPRKFYVATEIYCIIFHKETLPNWKKGQLQKISASISKTFILYSKPAAERGISSTTTVHRTVLFDRMEWKYAVKIDKKYKAGPAVHSLKKFIRIGD